MNLEPVTIKAQPFLYVSHTIDMTPAAIRNVMDESFRTLGGFFGQNGVAPSGPPIALYRDFTTDGVTIDVGFPVGESGLAKAHGEVKAGTTPSGKALKGIHRGPYDQLRGTYAALEGEMNKAGIPMPARMWEVYPSDPEKTSTADLVTEIYLPVA
ncbi:MAG: GyrI-like domain-containing protein [Bauldia sp.]|nr:GyrI-like domain-containing protein [Bauldia sp.]